MNLTETTRILTRILDQTEYCIDRNGKRLQEAKKERMPSRSTKLWIESSKERMILLNEEVDALRQAIVDTRKQIEYQDWTNKEFLTPKI